MSSSTSSPSSIHEREIRGSSTPKRTQSFSQISTNSLPDIKELNDTSPTNSPTKTSTSTTTSASTNERPRSKSHQHNSPLEEEDANGLQSVSKQSSLPSSLPIGKANLMKASTQADLMASLEMMNSLAADLPNATGSLKRSLTLQPVKNNKPVIEVSKKPPLPKLSLTSPVTSGESSSNPPPFLRHNSSPSPSVCSSNSAESSSPRPTRAAELLMKLQQAHNSNFANPLVIEEEETVPQMSSSSSSSVTSQPPAVPVRRYHRVVVNPMQETTLRSVSPSPPPAPDSGVAMSPQIMPRHYRHSEESGHAFLSDDAGSVGSSALSVESESRYDNVEICHRQQQTKDEDGDDEAEGSETSSIRSSENNLNIYGMESDCERKKNRGPLHLSFPPPPPPDLLPQQSRPMTLEDRVQRRKNSQNRASGPYDNVPNIATKDNNTDDSEDEDTSMATVYNKPLKNSFKRKVKNELEVKEDTEEDLTQAQRSILVNAPSSNV